MGRKKLTLTLDEAVIESARRYAEAHDTSISRLVNRFLDSLPNGEPRTTPVVARLSGILPPGVDRDELRQHLAKKHGR